VLDMTAPQPTTPSTPQVSYWQVPSSDRSPDVLIPALRARLVALVAALIVQATIALLGVLPNLPAAPGAPNPSDGYYYSDPGRPVTFWIQFAVIELIAALVVSLAFGPGVRFGRLPAIAKLILGLGFVVLPAVALVLGGTDAARTAASVSPAVAASSWLSTATFGTLFFGLPLVALVAPIGQATTKAGS
jgi:hypothetical protein